MALRAGRRQLADKRLARTAQATIARKQRRAAAKPAKQHPVDPTNGPPDGKIAAISPELVRQRLAELRPVLANAIAGDFSQDLRIPDQEDEFTELFAGVQRMQEVIREQLQELRELNQKLAAKASERSRALEAAQALTHLGSWEFDIASGDISWSDELYRIYGLKPQERQVGFEEFMGMIHPMDREHVSSVISASFQSGKPFEFEHRIVLPTGEIRSLFGAGKVVTDKQGKPLRMVGTSQDITERRASELALMQSDERFRTVTKATHDLVYDLNLETGEIWFNEALQSEYGYTKQKGGRSLEWWLGRIHPEDLGEVEEQIHQSPKRRQQTWQAEYRFQKADGSYVVVRNRAFVLRDASSRPSRIIGSCQDITRQKQLDRAKDEFISLVSHQLRTPLTVIRLYGNMLSDGVAGKLQAKQSAYVERITGASVRLIKLVSDILNVSRLELDRVKIVPETTDVNQLIQAHIDELTPIANDKQVTVNFRPNHKLDHVPLDTTIFGEILHNLISNAIRYAKPKHGWVNVSFDKRKGGDYLLTVSDNGIGIPLAAQAHIFERFFRASNASNVDGEGTGLGLYLVKLFADTAGGKAWFKSKEGQGTSFHVSFPPEGMRARQGSVSASSVL